jgi:uncharacterized membrane protein YhaH (DUF805 family)
LATTDAVTASADGLVCKRIQGYLFETLFGANGRISRATYWPSLLLFSVAGPFTATILLTTAAIAAPLFILMVVVVFIPWLIWGFAIHTERLHDRDKSAWWVLVFYVVPGALSHFANVAWLAGTVGTALCFILALTGLALLIWGFVEIGSLRGTAGPNRCGANSLAARNLNSVRSATP